MSTQYQILMRQQRANGGRLSREEKRAVAEAKVDEITRRYDAIYGSGAVARAWRKFVGEVTTSFRSR